LMKTKNGVFLLSLLISTSSFSGAAGLSISLAKFNRELFGKNQLENKNLSCLLEDAPTACANIETTPIPTTKTSNIEAYTYEQLVALGVAATIPANINAETDDIVTPTEINATITHDPAITLDPTTAVVTVTSATAAINTASGNVTVDGNTSKALIITPEFATLPVTPTNAAVTLLATLPDTARSFTIFNGTANEANVTCTADTCFKNLTCAIGEHVTVSSVAASGSAPVATMSTSSTAPVITVTAPLLGGLDRTGAVTGNTGTAALVVGCEPTTGTGAADVVTTNLATNLKNIETAAVPAPEASSGCSAVSGSTNSSALFLVLAAIALGLVSRKRKSNC
ncbi:MAG: hypothetical protein WCK49_03840, partial [Myxococcaceae bacterium]